MIDRKESRLTSTITRTYVKKTKYTVFFYRLFIVTLPLLMFWWDKMKLVK